MNNHIFSIFSRWKLYPKLLTSHFAAFNQRRCLIIDNKGKPIHLKVFSRRGLISNSERHMFRRSYRYVVRGCQLRFFSDWMQLYFSLTAFSISLKKDKLITQSYLLFISFYSKFELCLHARNATKSPNLCAGNW